MFFALCFFMLFHYTTIYAFCQLFARFVEVRKKPPSMYKLTETEEKRPPAYCYSRLRSRFLCTERVYFYKNFSEKNKCRAKSFFLPVGGYI